MADPINYNDVDFEHFLYTQTYLCIILSAIGFTIVFLVGYYLIVPVVITPYFHHIKPYEFLHWKIINILVSMLHGLIIITLCLVFDDILFFSVTKEIIDTETTKKEMAISSISIGYFIYDTIVNCIIFSKIHTQKFNNIYLFHHVIAIIGLTICIITVYSGRLVIIGFFANEISNPLLHLNNLKNKLLPRNKLNKQLLFIDLMSKSLYLTIFIIARFIWLGHITYGAIFVYQCSIYIQIDGVSIIVLSIVLIPNLVKDLNKTYTKYKNTENIQYSQVEQVSTTTAELTESDENEEDEQEDVEDKYNKILSLSTKSVTKFFVAGTMYSFFHTNRMAIYVLYAQEFNPSTMELAFLLYGYNFWNGMACLLYGSLANQYGYDFILVILLMVQCIAVLLEFVANSFYVLFIGIILGQVSITYIVFGYIAWILPHQYATKFTSYFYATFMVSYLIGPISAGFLSFYVSNRSVFAINFVLCIGAFIHSLFAIVRKQKELELKQLDVQLLENKSEGEQFPICLERFKRNRVLEEENAWYTLPNMSLSQWFMLLSILYINTSVSIGETCFVIYYSMYIIQDLRGNVIIGTGGIVVLSIAFIIGNLIVPKWFGSESIGNDNINQQIEERSIDGIQQNEVHINIVIKHLKNKYVVLLICLVVLIFELIFLYPMMNTLTLYWIYDITLGLPLGILSMTSEMMMLEIQSTKDSGKVSGGKGLLRNWLKAVALLITTFLWNITHNSFYYVVALFFILAVLNTLTMMYIKNKYQNNQTQDN